MRLAEHRYQTVTSVQGPLLFLDQVLEASLGETVRIVFPDGRELEGEILKISGETVLVQIFGESRGLDAVKTTVILTDTVKSAPLSLDMLDRIFDGSFAPVDGLPMFVPETFQPVGGDPINPTARERPREFIETGISSIDCLITLVKGQKLPIFSCSGLPCKELVATILRQARIGRARDAGAPRSAMVFVALGLTFHEYSFYIETLRRDMRTPFVAFVNLADAPAVERLLAPRFGLTVAEYLAFTHGMDVLVVVSDITNYCDALREVSTAREELPGRRGYPGYMYSDLASLFERAGRIQGLPGSVTMLPVVTMPEDDITHPIPDLTGYITEGQIVLSRELHHKAIFPPIDVLPSLSRLMHQGIGDGMTGPGHKEIANLLYRHYARGRELRNLEAIVGRDGMSHGDIVFLEFTEAFERQFINQGSTRRDMAASLSAGGKLLRDFGLLP